MFKSTVIHVRLIQSTGLDWDEDSKAAEVQNLRKYL